MKAVGYYLLAALFGAIGVVAVVRAVEAFVHAQGGGPSGMQSGIGLGFLFFGWKVLQKGRTRRLPGKRA